MSGSTTRNAIANVLQVLISAIQLFFLYRYISTNLGVDKFGVWSVVLATASASRLADLGLSAGVTRFVARYLALAMPNKAAQVVETVIVTLSLLIMLILVGMHSLAQLFLAHFFDDMYLPLAVEILPYALISLWLTIITSIVQSGLDGCQRMVPRAVLVVLAQSLMVGLAFALAPHWGLLGLAWAQVAQGLGLLLASWFVLRRSLPELPWLPWRWSWSVFREVLGYGANVQLANIFMMLLDPITKLLMAKFGGPVAVGYFEMANQVVMRARTLVVAANQAIVPKVVHIMEVDSSSLAVLYRENIRVVVLVALPVHALLFSWGGWISELLLGRCEPFFVIFMQVGILAWMLNTFSGPAYFINMGSGNVRLNTLSHVVMGGLNFGLGYLFGFLYGATGVVAGYALALISGSVLLIVAFHVRHAICWRELMLGESLPLAGVCLGISLFSIFFDFIDTGMAVNFRSGLSLIFPLLILSVFIWLHPLRSTLYKQICNVLLGKMG